MVDKQLRVVVIGAGMAGILSGIKLKEAGFNDVSIYEKADRIGGTWRENTYPGLTCDTPSHHYTYTFERNPDWTRYLPPGSEIQAYFERTVEKYNVEELIRFNSEVTKAVFRQGQWHLELSDGSSDIADIVISATGVLHHPSTPSFPGMENFEGEIFHSARWDHSVSLEGKRVGVIGMGSTGVQIISALAGQVKQVSHFVRNPQWVMPVENGHYSEQQRAGFRADPALLEEEMNVEEYNANVELYTLAITDPTSEGAQIMRQACFDNLEQSVLDPELREQFRPDHEPLCKRLIFSPDYYECIQKPGASLVREDIECFEKNGIRTKDGVLHEFDVIAIATGFKTDQFMRSINLVGRNGLDLETLWTKKPRAYMAISMPDFPNFFMLNGPNGPVGNFSLVDIVEKQWHYVAQLLEKIRSGDCAEVCATHAALDQFDVERTAAAKTTIWYTGGCQSWYLDAEGIPASWPWNYTRFVEEMAEPKWDAYELVKDTAPATEDVELA